jgi:ketosteroid isomerase-like protein
VSILGIAVGGVLIPCDARAQEEMPMATAIDVVRAAFAALDAGDMASATAAFAPSLVYRLHGEHPLAGKFDGKAAPRARSPRAGRRCRTGRERRRDDHPRRGREHHGDRERLVPRARRSLGRGLDRR